MHSPANMSPFRGAGSALVAIHDGTAGHSRALAWGATLGGRLGATGGLEER